MAQMATMPTTAPAAMAAVLLFGLGAGVGETVVEGLCV